MRMINCLSSKSLTALSKVAGECAYHEDTQKADTCFHGITKMSRIIASQGR